MSTAVDPLTLIHGDALSSLRTLLDESVQCCVTSPPYWGLRDYGTATWEGGDQGCGHLMSQGQRQDTGRGNHNGGKPGFHGGAESDLRAKPFRDTCGKCGARRVDVQIGLEKTPDEYVSRLVEIFREVKRVLRQDGTLWLNLGDCYAGSWGNYGGQNRGNGKQRDITSGSKAPQKSYEGLEAWKPPTANSLSGLKPKDLVGIPWMVAFALRTDGWYLRSDIIWHKPNPMPESVTDRPTKSHEYIFLLSKSERYYYDQEAIKEPYTDSSLERYEYSAIGKTGKTAGPDYVIKSNESMNGLGVTRSTAALKSHEHKVHPSGRNKRTVWTVTTQPFSGAHFATFPPDLIKPCILAGAPVGGVVIDPFAGSFTTCKVAIELGRKAIGIEPKAEYVEMGRRRCQTTIGLPLAYEQPGEAAQVPPDVLGDAQLGLGTEDCVESR